MTLYLCIFYKTFRHPVTSPEMLNICCFMKNHNTRSLLKTEGSSFGLSHIFLGLKVHVWQLKLSDQFFNDLIFCLPPRGDKVEKFELKFSCLVFMKSQKVTNI